MARISTKALEKIQQALENYHNVCKENLRTPISQNTYYDYAKRFVRWLNNDFTPGEKLKHSN